MKELFFVELQALAYYFTKSNTISWVLKIIKRQAHFLSILSQGVLTKGYMKVDS